MSENFAGRLESGLHRAELAPEHGDDFARLCRSLAHGPPFQLWLAAYGDSAYRDRVIAHVGAVLQGDGIASEIVPLTEDATEIREAESVWRAAASRAQVLHVTGAQDWFDEARWRGFNLRREEIARNLGARLVLWLNRDQIAQAADWAPDWWAWRAGVVEFVREVDPSERVPAPQLGPFDSRPMEERVKRIAILRDWLGRKPQLDDDVRVALLTELALLLGDLGQRDEELRVLREQVVPACERLGDVRKKAMSLGNVAGILHRRGQLDEGLEILREEVVPVFDRLGDVRSKAVAMGQIADILQDRGQVDEALGIRQAEQLPVFERLGDVRSKAVTMGQIAKILQARGQVGEALRIHQEEELPVYERLGDVRSKAVTMGQIADILQARGQLDEALRIRQEEEVPVYERLGDVREKAVAMGKIADILQARGQVDEALRILHEELVPVFERLRDLHSTAATMGRIARIMHARGQVDEALAVRKEEELPVYERLGDVRSLLISRTNLAIALAQRALPEDRPEIASLLTQAHAAAVAMRIPEADQIAKLYADLVGKPLPDPPPAPEPPSNPAD